jgi:hypothetical protein
MVKADVSAAVAGFFKFLKVIENLLTSKFASSSVVLPSGSNPHP